MFGEKLAEIVVGTAIEVALDYLTPEESEIFYQEIKAKLVAPEKYNDS